MSFQVYGDLMSWSYERCHERCENWSWSVGSSRQSLKVARAAVRFDVLESADVGADLAAQLPFYGKLFYCFAQRRLLSFGKFFRARSNVDAEFGQCGNGALTAHAIQAGERDLKALFIRYCDASYSHDCVLEFKYFIHYTSYILSPLPLFVPRIAANHPQATTALHAAAVQADFFNRRLDFHGKINLGGRFELSRHKNPTEAEPCLLPEP